MAYNRISNIIKKEWETIFRSVNNALFVTVLPLLIIGQFLILLYLVRKYVSDESIRQILDNSMFQNAISNLRYIASSDLGSISIAERFQLLLVNQFLLYILLIPTMIAFSFSTFSILEEKQTRTLEPLLATPVRTYELLLGKALAGAIPAIVLSWIYICIFLTTVIRIIPSYLMKLLPISSWLILGLLMVPAISFLSFMLGVVSSSKANDIRNAQNMAMFIILPVLALIAAQVTGILVFAPLSLVLVAFCIGILDIIVLRIATRLFHRESILVKWK